MWTPLPASQEDQSQPYWPVKGSAELDTAKLGREKAYRELYNSVSAHVRNGTYALTDCFNLTPPDDRGHFVSALCSWSVWPVYLGLIVAYALVRASGLLK